LVGYVERPDLAIDHGPAMQGRIRKKISLTWIGLT